MCDIYNKKDKEKDSSTNNLQIQIDPNININNGNYPNSPNGRLTTDENKPEEVYVKSKLQISKSPLPHAHKYNSRKSTFTSQIRASSNGARERHFKERESTKSTNNLIKSQTIQNNKSLKNKNHK
jgi:hypothetical protein